MTLGSDDLFKKRREARKQRKYEQRQPRANSFLIVTEGQCTEPNYFRGLQRLIQEKLGGTVDVVELPLIDVHGEGLATTALIQKTEDIVRRANVLYQNIWIVFDKDDFTDFNQAVKESTEKGYHAAWSNQSFEYWLYLHFEYSDSALHRSQWCIKLNKMFERHGIGDGKYHKNEKDIYKIADSYGSVHAAVRNAKRRMAAYDAGTMKPSEFNPGTMVYELVEKLKGYLV